MRGHRPDEPRGAATARARFEQPKTVTAGLFRSLIDGLSDDRRWVILDLGPVHQRTLALLEGKRCMLSVVDLASEIDGRGSVHADECAEMLALPPIRNAERVDVVFCWDLLNYLDRESLRALMATVAERCRSGALVHAFVVYSERVMHDRPGQLVPVDAGTFIDVAGETPTRPAPRYSTEALTEAMPDYTVERVRLLGNGMQEYLFKIRSVRGAVDEGAAAAVG